MAMRVMASRWRRLRRVFLFLATPRSDSRVRLIIGLVLLA
jgi:hypothetical protein